MKKINMKISSRLMVVLVVIAITTAAIGLTLELTTTFVRASGRFNLPLSWILSPSGTSVDTDNNGIVDYVDAGMPSGLIAMFDSACPPDWTEVTNFQNKFPRGHDADSTYCETGGSDTHDHPVSIGGVGTNTTGAHGHTTNACTCTVSPCGSHAHTLANAGSACGSWDVYTRCNVTNTVGDHTHTINIGGVATDSQGGHGHTTNSCSVTSDSGSNIPAYREVVFCEKD